MDVLIADDHVLVREGIKSFLRAEENDIKVMGEVSDGDTAVRFVRMKKPDILLLKMHIKKMNAFNVVRRVHLMTKVIILSSGAEDEKYVTELSTMGVRGCLHPEMSKTELIAALYSVQKGGSYFPFSLSGSTLHKNTVRIDMNRKLLTSRELEILHLIGKGMSNIEIASVLFVSEKTVKNHMTNIFKKIDVNDRTQALIYALKHKIIML